MDAQIHKRSSWDIDQRLTALVGCSVRVRAESLIFNRWNGEAHPVTTGNLILPDGSGIHREPVFVEGTLREFTRRVSVVFVELDPLSFTGAADGRVLFRGSPAVILRAPATVELHRSHFVERLPADVNAYWKHLSTVDPQMDLPFGD